MRLLSSEDGTAMMEVALALPLLTVLLMGVCNIGLAIDKNIVLADSARAGAAVATTVGNATNTALMQSVATASAGTIPNYSVTATNFCTCSPGSVSPVPCNSFCSGYGQPAMFAQVTATAAIPLMFMSTTTLPLKAVVRVRIACPSC